MLGEQLFVRRIVSVKATVDSSPLDRRFRRNVDLATREVLEETLIVPIRGEIAHLQQIFVLNPVAALIWNSLDGERSLASVLDRVLNEFEVDAEEAQRDIVEFVSSLSTAGLVTLEEPLAEASRHEG